MTTHARLGFVLTASLVALTACGQGTPAGAGASTVSREGAPAEAGEVAEQPEVTPGAAGEVGAAGEASAAGKEGGEPEPSPELAEPSVGVAPMPGGSEPGPAYFVINTKGIVRLDHEGTKLVLDKPERHISDMFIGPDGAVYVLDARSLRKIEGDTLVEVASFSFDDIAPVDDLALARDGTLWVVGAKGVGARVDGKWEMTPLEDLGLDFGSEVAIAGDDSVWVIGSKAVLYRDGDANRWVPIDLSILGSVPLLLNPIASPMGPVHTTNGKKLTRLGKTSLESVLVETKGLISYTADLDISADGHAGLTTGACDLARVNPTPPTLIWRLAGTEYDCETAEALALDARHRFWVASREGLSVVGEDRQVREYPAGSFAELAGRVSHMVVVGQGPELPAAPPVHVATLVGRVQIESKAAAEVPIELCPTVRLYGKDSPCGPAKVKFAGTTGADGGFRFEGVPIGDYSIAVEVEGKWRWSSPPSFAAAVVEGEDYDLGELRLPKI